MNTPAKILIVEDEMVIAANISLQLSELGYKVIGILPRGRDALAQIQEEMPDIVIMDVHLKGELNGIETAKLMQETHRIAIIYVTAKSDEVYFKHAQQTHSFGFISKPFKKLDLQRIIELTIERIASKKREEPRKTSFLSKNSSNNFIVNDRIFVKHRENMIKIDIKDIHYIEADRNYCRVFSKDKTYLLVGTLKNMEEKLPSKHFLRIHRSYIINLRCIDEIGGTHVVIARKTIPMSKAIRAKLLMCLRTI